MKYIVLTRQRILCDVYQAPKETELLLAHHCAASKFVLHTAECSVGYILKLGATQNKVRGAEVE